MTGSEESAGLKIPETQKREDNFTAQEGLVKRLFSISKQARGIFNCSAALYSINSNLYSIMSNQR
jgi:hypothetical protein